MAIKTTLTNEKLRDRFDNPFTLVNYAINLAKKRIERGEGVTANPVNEVIEVLAKKEDILGIEVDEEDEEEEEFDENGAF